MATNKCPNGHQYNSNIFGDKCPFCLENSHKHISQVSERRHNSVRCVQYINDADWKNVSRIEYRFGESSIPPQYHRSYTISICASSKTISIDCYGKELLKREYQSTIFEFQRLKEILSVLGISKHEETDSHGCTGGKTEYLRLYKGEFCSFDGYVYHCVGDWGTLNLPKEVSELICDTIPEGVKSLIESTL